MQHEQAHEKDTTNASGREAPFSVLAPDGVSAAHRAVLEHAPKVLEHMIRARLVSARMALLQRTERIGFHTTSIGFEAVTVGAALAASSTDWVFPGVRDWYAALARGLPIASYVHHAFGSAADLAKGHSSPDHAPARAVHVVPASGVLGAHVPQAVGAAWAAKIKKDAVATVALFPSEVCEGGDFHNAMNFAGVFKAPAVLVCQRKREDAKSPQIEERAVAYGVASARVDGSDALAVFTVVRAALERAHAGKGATLIEAVMPALPIATLDDASLADAETILSLGDKDPIVRLRAALATTKERADEITAAVRAELDAAIDAAEKAGPPRAATIFDDVYASLPPHLAQQRREIERAT